MQTIVTTSETVDINMRRLQEIQTIVEQQRVAHDTSNIKEVLELHDEAMMIAESIEKFLSSVIDTKDRI